MIRVLDFAIFGDGHGMGAPYFSQTFYWLVDGFTERGTFYTWSGWFGSQLQSFQWTHPNAGEERLLAGKRFRPFQSHRQWGRVRVSWACSELETTEQIRAFQAGLPHSAAYYR